MIKDTFPMNIGGEKVRSERTLLAGVGERQKHDVCRLCEISGTALLGYPMQSGL